MSRGTKMLGDAAEDYIRYRTATTALTSSRNEAFVIRRFVAAVGDRQLRHLRSDHVFAWFYGSPGSAGLMQPHLTRDGVARPPLQGSTHNNYRTRLSSFFAFCTRKGWLSEDLLVDIRAQGAAHKHRYQPSADEMLAFIKSASNGRDRAYLAVAANLGLRISEIKQLRVGSVDLSSLTIYVKIYKSRSEDAMPVTSDLRDELSPWLSEYAGSLGRPLRAADYLFPAKRGGRYLWVVESDGQRVRTRTSDSWEPLRPAMHMERVVQACLRGLGIPTKGEGIHTIRRGAARAFFDSISEDKGYDAALRTVAAFLHHKSVTTTEGYLGLTSEQVWRDQRLRGQPFLTAMSTDAKVIPLRRPSSH